MTPSSAGAQRLAVRVILVCCIVAASSVFPGASASDATRPALILSGDKPLSELIVHPGLDSLKNDYRLYIEFRADVTASGKIRKFIPLAMHHEHLGLAEGEQPEPHGCICPAEIIKQQMDVFRKARVVPATIDGKAVRVGIVGSVVYESVGGELSATLYPHTIDRGAVGNPALIAPQVLGGWREFLEALERPRGKSGRSLHVEDPLFHVTTQVDISVNQDGTLMEHGLAVEGETPEFWEPALLAALANLEYLPAHKNDRPVDLALQISVSSRSEVPRSGSGRSPDYVLDWFYNSSKDYQARLKDQINHPTPLAPANVRR